MKGSIAIRAAWTLMAFFALAAILPAVGQENGSKAQGSWAISIKKSEITPTAKFYSIKINDKPVEIFAVRAFDGTIRTALNTCQVCYASSRGYFKQEGNIFICQNCGNRFSLDQIGKGRGGCNPIPILGKDKTDLGDSIGISEKYLRSVAPYFEKWKKI
ncbi:MAG: hypothetical protein FD137_1446 [Spirochaetes bacterium]|nr:MAG: hypothetical protein FD137_1446 [Spirochaetota bacterium]